MRDDDAKVTTAERRLRVSRLDIERVLCTITLGDAAAVEQLLQSVFASGKRRADARDLIKLLRSSELSDSRKCLALFVHRAWRTWSDAPLLESVAAIKDLAWLRARLLAVVPVPAQTIARTHADDELIRVPAEPGADASTIVEDGISRTFQIFLGRAPFQAEVSYWESSVGDSLKFAQFMCAVHDSSEGKQYHALNSIDFAARDGGLSERGSLVADDPIREAIINTYRMILGRTPVEHEISHYAVSLCNDLCFPAFIRALQESDEAAANREMTLASLQAGQFIQLVFETIRGRGIKARNLAALERQLASGSLSRLALLNNTFKEYLSASAAQPHPSAKQSHQADSIQIVGTDQLLSMKVWREKAQGLASGDKSDQNQFAPHSRFYITSKPAVLVTAITSLYRGGSFIEQFMENITSQSCFDDYCELVIIDADSPENEAKVIEKYCRSRTNIIYHRVNYRIGIYDAWNLGVRMARGEYITSTNVDDLRRNDSLELQAGTLDSLPFVDVVYQDFFYSWESGLHYEEVARFGFKSNLPVVTAYSLMDFNAPHNAPMWRKRLHDELGYFNTSYKSAGDYEFWIRCLLANKSFFKLNDPHVVYYYNPDGISTTADSRGAQEVQAILKEYGRRLVSENVGMSEASFSREVPARAVARQEVIPSRYGLCQQALRLLAIDSKRPPNTDERCL